MEHKDKFNAIQFIRPNAQFTLRGNNIEWLDKNQIEPTDAEIETGLLAYKAAQEAKAEAMAEAKVELLKRLGLTQEQFNILIA